MFTQAKRKKETQKSISVSTRNSQREQQAETVSRQIGYPPAKALPLTNVPPETTTIPINSFDYNQSSGRPLPADLSKEMNAMFQNRDFLQTKIHTDSHAADLCKKIHAKAFTIGTDIYFNQGQFHPHTEKGKQLLAHELAHTIQPPDSTPIVYRSLLEGNLYPLLEAEQKEEIDQQTEEAYRNEIVSYEKELGKGLSLLPQSKEGADFLADKIIEILQEEILPEETGDKESKNRKIQEYLGDNGDSYLGKIKYTITSLEKIKTNGNLREKMTLAWNFVSKGLAKTVAHPKGSLHLSQSLINDPLFAKRDQSNPRNITHRSSTISLAAVQRKNRDTAQNPLQPEDYVQESIFDELSYREIKNTYYYDSLYQSHGDPAARKQRWKEQKQLVPRNQIPQVLRVNTVHFEKGAVHYELKDEYKKYCEQLGMLFTAGYSGSTNMYYQAGVYFGADSEQMKKIRLAALGTMIPAGDHSFLEIMIAGQDFGMPFLPAPDSYSPVSPLSMEQTLQSAKGRKKYNHGDNPVLPCQYEPAFYRSVQFKNALAYQYFQNLSELDTTFTIDQKEILQREFALPENPFEINFPLKSDHLKKIFPFPESFILFDPLNMLSTSNEPEQNLETLKSVKKNCTSALQKEHSPEFRQSLLFVIQYSTQHIRRLEEIKNITTVLSGGIYTPIETGQNLTSEAKQTINRRIRTATAARELSEEAFSDFHLNEIIEGFQKPFLYGGIFTTFNLLNASESSIFSGISDPAKFQTLLEQQRLEPKQIETLQLFAAGLISPSGMTPEEMNALVAWEGGEAEEKELKYIQILPCLFDASNLLKSAQKIVSNPQKLKSCLLIVSAIKKLGEKEAAQYTQKKCLYQLEENYLHHFKEFYDRYPSKISLNDLNLQNLEQIITAFESTI